MKNQNNISGQNENDTGSFNIRLEIERYSRYWKWFLFGAMFSLAIAFVYLRYSTPKYKAVASILIKDNKKSGLSAELEAFC